MGNLRKNRQLRVGQQSIGKIAEKVSNFFGVW